MSPAQFISTPDSSWIRTEKAPFLIAGPCSIESEEQLMNTARAIAAGGKASVLRAGVWKPRTRPGSFEGLGAVSLNWLQQVKQETGLRVATEVANAYHVEEALKHDIDILWLGARTTVNPFYVQEIAEALRGSKIPVMVKNPIHADMGLWIGALERLNKVGIEQLAAIHRGFHSYESAPYRNQPKWEMVIELRSLVPELPIICDPSHIAGDRKLIAAVSQIALDLNLDGLMIESHCDPDKALSDAKQQITPNALDQIVDGLQLRESSSDDMTYMKRISELRDVIDNLDADLLKLISKRMDLVSEIGIYKRENNVSIFQLQRFFEILRTRKDLADDMDLSPKLIHELFELIHKHSIRIQTKIQ
jgi:chorismate mutase